MEIAEKNSILKEAIAAFAWPETIQGIARYGSGHINDTYCIVCQPREGKAIRFILQGLSLTAFPKQVELMENFIGVTTHLRKKIQEQGGDPMRETLNLIKTKDGKDYYTDSTGKIWRLMPFVEHQALLYDISTKHLLAF